MTCGMAHCQDEFLSVAGELSPAYMDSALGPMQAKPQASEALGSVVFTL